MSIPKYEIALSFPGEHRSYVEKVANELASRLGRDAIFYDNWYKDLLARPNLDVFLQKIYRHRSKLIVAFFGTDYQKKQWCGLEWRAIRDLMKQRADDQVMPFRSDDGDVDGVFSIDGYVSTKGLRPKAAAELIIGRLKTLHSGVRKNQFRSRSKVIVDTLPTIPGIFVGRTQELQELDHACANAKVKMIEFVAAGGTGKTKLIRHWLDQNPSHRTVIAWSFYSQGSHEHRQVSSTPFFIAVSKALGSVKANFESDEERGRYLASLLARSKCILVLDGLEPLQHSTPAIRGYLKDTGMRAFLQALLGNFNGLCVMTTRIALADFAGRAGVASKSLENLPPPSAVELLQALGVKSTRQVLKDVAKSLGHNALALHLLGSVVRIRFEGDFHAYEQAGQGLFGGQQAIAAHAEKVMLSYELHLAGTHELLLMRLMSLFDRPVAMQTLMTIATARLKGWQACTSIEFREALSALRDDYRLVAEFGDDVRIVDCHPLIREFFAERVSRENSRAWKTAHARLAQIYLDTQLAHQPDSLEELQPLCRAVAHACAAGLHQKAWDEVYRPRILRGDDHYIAHTLGAISEDLSLLANFFDELWLKPVESLSPSWQAEALNKVGFHLRAIGRLSDARSVMELLAKRDLSQRRWRLAAIGLNNLSELHLMLGDISAAISQAEKAVYYADESEDGIEMRDERTTLAEALHHAGRSVEAYGLFQSAEFAQSGLADQPRYLYGLRGYRYCELLLDLDRTEEALQRALFMEHSLEQRVSLLGRGLQALALGKTYLALYANLARSSDANSSTGEMLARAGAMLSTAVQRLRSAGQEPYVLAGVLARARYYRLVRNISGAWDDIDEVLVAARRSGLLPLLCDANIEASRLTLVTNRPRSRSGERLRPPFEEFISEARAVAEKTRYERRLSEIGALQMLAKI